MATVTLEEAQEKLGELVKSLPSQGEVVITQGDRPVAKLSLPRAPYSVMDIPPLQLGEMKRPFPHAGDDLLDEMIQEKMDQVFPRLPSA